MRFKCEIPDCDYETDHRSYVANHHVIPVELGGSNAPWNRLWCCPFVSSVFKCIICKEVNQMVIYKTVNTFNGKFYVGKDTNDNPNYLGSGRIFLCALKKYGRASFVKVILERCSSVETLNEREKFWIKKLRASRKYGNYNLAEGGEGGDVFSSLSKSEQSNMRRKVVASLIGRPCSETTKERMRFSALGHAVSNAAKEKIGKASIERDAYKALHTEEAIKKNGDARKIKFTHFDTFKILCLYRKGEKTIGEIGSVFGVTQPVINRLLKEANEPRRSRLLKISEHRLKISNTLKKKHEKV